MIIKICGVMDPEIAFYAAQEGADMVGFICCPNSRRHVTYAQGAEIVKAVKEGGAIPVGVFKDVDSDSIASLCPLWNIEALQLYGIYPEPFQQYVRIIANAPMSDLDPQRDYLLFDSERPGSGMLFDWKTFQSPQGIRWFLSGGLNSSNVMEGIQLLKPDGVDVSSGVEEKGLKSKQLIKQFIDKVRSHG
ncbi:MAG: phosphoribosylanthranilate isomerase [Parachlamydia sp.]|nr:phosphoribosylanthranilate isomerase [Parachlamydia sp.]